MGEYPFFGEIGRVAMKETFDITGMTCAACSARVGKAACAVPGVEEANVNLLKNSMELVYDGTDATCDAVISAIEKAGYGAAPRTPHGPRNWSSVLNFALPPIRAGKAMWGWYNAGCENEALGGLHRLNRGAGATYVAAQC